jgi:hypothetical protein
MKHWVFALHSLKGVLGWFIFLLGGLLQAAEACASQEIRHGDLTLQVTEWEKTISLFYKDVRVVTDIGKFECYAIGIGGQRTILLSGPFGSGRRVESDRREARVVADATKNGGANYELKLRIEDHNALRMSVDITVPVSLQVSGLQLDIGSMFADWIKGGVVEVAEAANAKKLRVTIPIAPTDPDHRYLVKDKELLQIHSALFNLSVQGLNGTSTVSLADMRGTPWDMKQVILAYGSKKPLMPGSRYHFEYEITFREPASRLERQFQAKAPSLSTSREEVPNGDLLGRVIFQGPPAIPIRGQVMELSKPAIKDKELFKRYIDTIAKAHGNTLILYHNPAHVRALSDGVSDKEWWSREDLVDVIAHATSRGIKVIPGMWSKFNPKEFSGIMPKERPGNFYCISNPEAYRTVFKLYDVLLEIYRPDAFLIGHDEIQNLMACAAKGDAPGNVFAKDVATIHSWLGERGVKTLMWGDMLLDFGSWESTVGSAHSGHPEYGSVTTAEAIDQLPKDIVILDWHYGEQPDYSSIGYFKDKGFQVWGIAWYRGINGINMAKSVTKYKAEGVLGSDWGFWATLSPATTSLYPLVAGWSREAQVSGDGKDGVTALARGLRGSIAGEVYQPISIDTAMNTSKVDSDPFDGVGLFDLGSAYDLRLMPGGKQIFGGVSFDLSVSTEHAQYDTVAVSHGSVNRMPLPHEVRIPIRVDRYRSLAFLHAAYVAAPQNAPRKIGAYVVEYTDGSKVEINLIESYNITDFRSSPGIRRNVWGRFVGVEEIVGAIPGWRGQALAQVSVNTQVLVWRNPAPGKAIQSVHLVADDIKEKSVIGLLGLSGSQ